MKRNITIEYEEFNDIQMLSNEDQKLVLAARQTLLYSYSPYSNFRVGAVVLLDDGTIIQGANQENVSYPSGLCAERVALFTACCDAKQRKVAKLVIAAEKNEQYVEVCPCGSCLQVMIDTEKRYKKELEVIIPLPQGRFAKIKGMKNFLPFAFKSF
ncbi:MAG: cytidine deaminase [Bacteroidales bacterium]|nr:cytidine deaminase [Bacteroidales bacterium]